MSMARGGNQTATQKPANNEFLVVPGLSLPRSYHMIPSFLHPFQKRKISPFSKSHS